MRLNGTGIHAGVWEGVLVEAGDTEPDLKALHDERELPGLTLAPVEGVSGQWRVRVPIPAETLGEGMQIYLIVAAAAAGVAPQRLCHFAILTGEPVGGDLSGEVALLRAELDLLKKAFRQGGA